MTYFGMMQGRLVPPEAGRLQCFPRARWQDEFALAAQVPLDYIEWIFDLYGYDVNPIATEQGVRVLNESQQHHKVGIRSVCADYFMERTFFCPPEELQIRLEDLFHLMRMAQQVRANRIVLPFVDASAIKTSQDLEAVVHVLETALPVSRETGVELHLETSLNPAEFRNLLDLVPDPMIKVNYDSGNSASLGYSPAEEFAAYGDRVGSVHIKDRKLGASTVPLGTGDADFPTLFRELEKIRYSGDITLQVARGTAGDEVAWARSNLDFVQQSLPAAQL